MRVRLWNDSPQRTEQLYRGTMFARFAEMVEQTPGIEGVATHPEEGEVLLHVHMGAVNLLPETIAGIMKVRPHPVISITDRPPFRWHLFHACRILYSENFRPDEPPPMMTADGNRAWLAAGFNKSGEVLWFETRRTGGDLPLREQTHHYRLMLIDPTCPEYAIPANLPGLWKFDSTVSEWRRESGELITGRQDAPRFLTVSPALMIGTEKEHIDREKVVRRGDATPFTISTHEAHLVRNEIDLLRLQLAQERAIAV